MPTAEVFRPIAAMRGFILTGTLIILVGNDCDIAVAAAAHIASADGSGTFDARDGGWHTPTGSAASQAQDEVGDLVLGFNYLVARLHEKEAALKGARRGWSSWRITIR